MDKTNDSSVMKAVKMGITIGYCLIGKPRRLYKLNPQLFPGG